MIFFSKLYESLYIFQVSLIKRNRKSKILMKQFSKNKKKHENQNSVKTKKNLKTKASKKFEKLLGQPRP